MAGIIKADAGGAGSRRVTLQLHRLGAGHVRTITAEPDQGGQAVSAFCLEDAHGNAARFGAVTDLKHVRIRIRQWQ